MAPLPPPLPAAESHKRRLSGASVLRVLPVVISLLALALSYGVARGAIRPPVETLRTLLEGNKTVQMFGTACRTDRGDTCLRSWSYKFTISKVSDGRFDAVLEWSFGGATTISGRFYDTMLTFSETAVQTPIPPQSIWLCDYVLTLDSAEQLHGTWAGCKDPDTAAAQDDEGRIWLAFNVG